jgi:hypothetical protein
MLQGAANEFEKFFEVVSLITERMRRFFDFSDQLRKF